MFNRKSDSGMANCKEANCYAWAKHGGRCKKHGHEEVKGPDTELDICRFQLCSGGNGDWLLRSDPPSHPNSIRLFPRLGQLFREVCYTGTPIALSDTTRQVEGFYSASDVAGQALRSWVMVGTDCTTW